MKSRFMLFSVMFSAVHRPPPPKRVCGSGGLPMALVQVSERSLRGRKVNPACPSATPEASMTLLGLSCQRSTWEQIISRGSSCQRCCQNFWLSLSLELRQATHFSLSIALFGTSPRLLTTVSLSRSRPRFTKQSLDLCQHTTSHKGTGHGLMTQGGRRLVASINKTRRARVTGRRACTRHTFVPIILNSRAASEISKWRQ